jgi:hypothetical protein
MRCNAIRADDTPLSVAKTVAYPFAAPRNASPLAPSIPSRQALPITRRKTARTKSRATIMGGHA